MDLEELLFENMGREAITHSGGAMYVGLRRLTFPPSFWTVGHYTLKNITFKKCRSHDGAAVLILNDSSGFSELGVVMDNVFVFSATSSEEGAISLIRANLTVRNR